MKRSKRTLLVLCLVFVGMLIASVSVSAATSGDYEYKTRGHGVVITKYNGNATEVAIPAKLDGKPVVAIGEESFAGNIHITKLTIPSSVRNIGKYAFESCGRLATIEFGEGVKKIDRGAFSGCCSLVSMTLPEGLETIGPFAFFACRMITEVSIPSTVETLGRGAFSDCQNLTTLTIPGNTELTEISDRAFYSCDIRNLVLPASIQTVGIKAFKGNQNIQTLDLGSVVNIKKEAFNDCGCENTSLELVIPSSVRNIGDEAFDGTPLKSLTIMEGVESIGEKTFSYCPESQGSSAQSITIPASVENLADGAFSMCMCGEYIVAEENAYYKSVDGVIYSKDGTTLVAYPHIKQGAYEIADGTEQIAGAAFMYAGGLEELTIPASVETIGAEAFVGVSNENLELTIPATVTTIGEGCFASASNKNITIEADIDSIAKGMFKECHVAEGISIPEGVEKICENAFYRNESNCTLPSTLEDVEDGAFLLSPATYTMREDSGSAGSIELVGETGTYNFLVKTSGSDKEIVAYMQQSATKPTTINIPAGITSVADYALVTEDDTVKQINIPASVSELGEFSVGYCEPNSEYYNYGLEVPDKDLRIISSSEAVLDYSRTNAIACYTASPSQNITSCTLAGDETKQLVVSNARLEDITFTSGDSKIATVDEEGNIKGERKGSTTVIASVGHDYFVCEVTVTSQAKNPYTPEFDESKYTVFTKDSYTTWFNDYVEYNKDNISQDPDENIFTQRYKGNAPTYYEAIWSVQSDDPMHKSKVTFEFGDDYEETAQMMAHGLIKELRRYKCQSDLALFSGTEDLDIILGIDHVNIPEIREYIGEKKKFDLTTSTSVDETVPIGFGDYVLLIYADKDTIDGGYIDAAFAQSGGEYEMLLNEDLDIKILDAGVRLKTVEKLSDGSTQQIYERYVKVALGTSSGGGGSTPTDPTSPTNTGDNSQIGLYMLMLAMALAGLAVMLAVRRKGHVK